MGTVGECMGAPETRDKVVAASTMQGPGSVRAQEESEVSLEWASCKGDSHLINQGNEFISVSPLRPSLLLYLSPLLS